jgi:hypothetical protein
MMDEPHKHISLYRYIGQLQGAIKALLWGHCPNLSDEKKKELEQLASSDLSEFKEKDNE